MTGGNWTQERYDLLQDLREQHARQLRAAERTLEAVKRIEIELAGGRGIAGKKAEGAEAS